MASVASFPCDKTIAASAPQGRPCAARAEPWILATTIIASSMAFIDGTVVNVAVPALQRSLGATLADVQWIVEAYELMLAALLLLGGAAGDLFGRRRVFAIGIVVFALASITCGLADRVDVLIIARAVQGIGGALLVPGSLALLSASFDKDRRGRAIGTWSGFTAITTALGPVIGGFLIDHGSWRYAFFLNVPLALAAIILTFRYIPESRSRPRSERIDWLGAALAAIALGAIVYALIGAQTAGWTDLKVLGALAIGLVALPSFVMVESRQSAPMLPLTLFRSRDFTGANVLTLLLYAALGGSLFFLPLNLIQVQGYSTLAAGAALLPFVLLMFVLSRWAGGLVERYGAKLPLVIGPAIAALGFGMFALSGIDMSYWTSFFPAVVVLGFGMTLTVAPLTTTVMQSVSQNDVGAASGVNNAVSTVAGLLAIAALGLVMSHTFNDALHRQLSDANIPPSIVQTVEAQRFKLAAIDLPPTDPETRVSVRHGVAAAFVSGFRRVMLIAALLAAGAALSAWIAIGAIRGSRN
ncbi:MAG: MFS transporter [Betaproteobacteria bacterium]|nr:MAG: MFS transporter [Betaproteobacteria bacterium]